MFKYLGWTNSCSVVAAIALSSWVSVEAQVSGPSQSTDNAAARWDGTAGDQLQDSKLIIGNDGEVNDIRFATAYNSASSCTGGIQEAIDSCGTGFSAGTHGCVVVLPRGEVAIEATIEVGGTDGKAGLVIVGHGSGQRTEPDGENMAGTTLVWQGSSGGTVLSVKKVSWSRFGDFAINGSGTAGIAIDVTTPLSWGSEEDLFENIYIDNLQATGSVGVRVAPPSGTSYQVSEISFRHFVIRRAATCFLQDGQQTANIRYENNDLGCTDICLQLADGTSMVTSNVFGSTADSFADIWIGQKMGPVTMIGNYHETQATHAVYTELDTFAVDGWKFDPITMIGSMISQYNDGEYIVYHQQPAPFNIIGGFLYVQNAGHDATLYFNNPATGGNNLKIFTAGTFYGTGVLTSFNGDYSLVSEDGLGSAPQVQSKTSVTQTNIAEVRRLGSENWASSSGAVKYSWFLNNPDTPGAEQLMLFSGSNSILGYYEGAKWVSHAATPLEFEGVNPNAIGIRTSVAVEEPTSNATITIPNSTGTVLLDSNASVTLDTEWDTASEINARTTDVDFVLASDGTVTRDTEWDTTSEINAATTDGDFATTTGTETLTNKTLTDSTNVFPPTTLVGFTVVNPGSSTKYGGPNSTNNDATESNVSLRLPRLTAGNLYCKATIGPGAGKTWRATIFKNGAATVLTCDISGGSGGAGCSYSSSSVAFAAGDLASLEVKKQSGTGSFNNATVACTVDGGP